MALSEFKGLLESNFHPPAAAGLDAVFELVIAGESLIFHVREGALDFELPADCRADATFRFDDTGTAWNLLSGKSDAFEAFMQGRFRADGYLMWAFALMSMFRSESLPAAPAE